MIKRILYPTDFSEHSKRCIDFILHIRDCGVQEVVLLHVVDKRVIVYGSIVSESTLDEENLIEDYTASSNKKLSAMAKRFKDAGLKTREITRIGEPFSEIIKVADEIDISLIVIGHRGHSRAEELLLGSTAEKVVRKSKKPVVLVR